MHRKPRVVRKPAVSTGPRSVLARSSTRTMANSTAAMIANMFFLREWMGFVNAIPDARRRQTAKIYNRPVQALNGPAAVVAACDHHPLARFAVGILAAPTGFTDEGATLFVGRPREDRDT